MSRIKDETINGAKWTLLQRCTLQPVTFLYGIILARLISPHEMGILGLTAIFFAVAGQLQSCGFGAALIRKLDRTEADCCTMFWFNIVASFICSSALALAAPLFAEFFHQPELVNLTRVSAFMMFLGSTSSVHWALYSARRDFRVPALIQMSVTLATIPLGVWAAFAGWSYWAVVFQGVMSNLFSLIAVWIISPWKPQFLFSWSSFRSFFSFGSKLTASGLITTLYDESRTFVIGKFYSTAQLAFFSRGFKLCYMPIDLCMGTLGSVIYPVMATIQDDEERLVQVYRKYLRLIACVTLGGMLALAANAHAVIELLYGSQWLPCTLYTQILCLGIMLNPLTHLNDSLYVVKGRSDLRLRTEMLTRCIGFPSMVIGAYFSVEGICYAAIFSACVTLLIKSYYLTTAVKISMVELFADFFPYLVLAIMANIPSFLLNFAGFSSYIMAPAGGLLSALLYYLLLRMRRDSALTMLIETMEEKGMFRKFRLGR